jgi:hypothetical protein
MPRTAGKKGALPQDLSRPRVRLGPAIRGTAPSQAHFGHIPVIGMLGNDEWGDCVDAGGGHLVEAATFYGQGKELEITTAQALAMYTAVAGFNPSAGPPGNNPTDNGSTLQAGLEYLVTPDNAYGYQFAAFGDLDVKNANQWQQALATFGPLMLGVGVGDAEQQQFEDGEPWSLTPGASPNAEDHCVILSGYQSGMYWCYTWGALQGITPAWFGVNAYEAWGIISRDWVNAHTGKDPEGVDLAVLGQEYTAITGQPDPFS